MTDAPATAIIVPSFNRPEQLEACLRSLMELDGPPPEIVIVDDGSPTPLEPVTSKFGSRVRCIRQENAGPAAARNAGVRASEAPFVAFTDDDCRPHPSWLVELLSVHGGRRERLVGGRVDNAVDDNVYSSASQSLCDYLYAYYGAADGEAPFFTSNNMGCARDRFIELEGFDVTFPLAAAEDREFGMRWRSTGGELVYAANAAVDHWHRLDLRRFWRQHSNYGRGARHLHGIMDRRSEKRPKIESVGFYANLVLHPIRKQGLKGAPQSAILALSQVAMTQGYFAAARAR